MHPFLIIIGIFLALMFFVHIVFRVIKFTLMIFVLGLALVAGLTFLQHNGIDPLSTLTGTPTPPV